MTLFPSGPGNQVVGLVDSGEVNGRQPVTDDVSITGAELASAQRQHRLLFATPELQTPVHLSGGYRVTLRLASDKPAANLSVWLVSLPWIDGATITRTSSAAAGPTPRTPTRSGPRSPWSRTASSTSPSTSSPTTR